MPSKEEEKAKADAGGEKKGETEDATKDESNDGEETEGEDKDKKKNFFNLEGLKKHLEIPDVNMDFMKPKAKRAKVPLPNKLWEHVLAKQWTFVGKDLDGDDASHMAQVWHEDDLPLHAICKDKRAPDDVILKMINANPDAATERGKNRMLPLQIAVYNKGSYDTIENLIFIYPDALDAKISDDKIRQETTRTWIDLQGHPPDVKRLLRRPLADWKVIIDYSTEQKESGQKIKSLGRKLKTAKKKFDAADRATHSLEEKVEALEAQYKKISVKIGDDLRLKRESMESDFVSMKERLQEFMDMQEGVNKARMRDLKMSEHRAVAARAVMEMKKAEIIGLFKERVKEIEVLHRDLMRLQLDYGDVASKQDPEPATKQDSDATTEQDSEPASEPTTEPATEDDEPRTGIFCS